MRVYIHMHAPHTHSYEVLRTSHRLANKPSSVWETSSLCVAGQGAEENPTNDIGYCHCCAASNSMNVTSFCWRLCSSDIEFEGMELEMTWMPPSQGPVLTESEDAVQNGKEEKKKQPYSPIQLYYLWRIIMTSMARNLNSAIVAFLTCQ